MKTPRPLYKRSLGSLVAFVSRAFKPASPLSSIVVDQLDAHKRSETAGFLVDVHGEDPTGASESTSPSKTNLSAPRASRSTLTPQIYLQASVGLCVSELGTLKVTERDVDERRASALMAEVAPQTQQRSTHRWV